jgi:hypothetical protein
MNHTNYRALVYVSVWTATCSLLSYFIITYISANWITNNKRKQNYKDKWNVIPIGFGMLSFTKMLKFVYTHPASGSMVIPCSIYLTQQSWQLIHLKHSYNKSFHILYLPKKYTHIYMTRNIKRATDWHFNKITTKSSENTIKISEPYDRYVWASSFIHIHLSINDKIISELLTA